MFKKMKTYDRIQGLKKEYSIYKEILETFNRRQDLNKEDRGVYDLALKEMDRLKTEIELLEKDFSKELKYKRTYTDFVKEVIGKQRTKTLATNENLIGFYELDFQECRTEFNLEDLLDKLPTDALKGQIPVNDYYIPDNFTEGEDEEIKISNYDEAGLNSLEYKINRAGFIVKIPSDKYYDARNVVTKATDNIVANRIVNYSNRRICSTLIGSIETPAAYTSISDVLNDIKGLPAKAKPVTYIITNTDGFKLLDTVDSNGNKLVKKNSEGSFIFDDKYKLIEVNNNVLPSDDTKGVPIIVGDIATAVKKVTYKEPRIKVIEQPDTTLIDDYVLTRVITHDTFASACNDCIKVGYYKASV